MFLVISVYFNLRNILPKSGTFTPGTPSILYFGQIKQNTSEHFYTMAFICRQLKIRPREAMTRNRPKRQTRIGREDGRGVSVVTVLSSRVPVLQRCKTVHSHILQRY